MPWISDRLLHTRHFRALNFGRSYCTPGNIVPEFYIVITTYAFSCPSFRTDFCTPGNVMSQIWGRLLENKSDNIDFSDRPLHFWSMMSQNPLIPTENENELSRNPDSSCRFKNAIFQISGTSSQGFGNVTEIWGLVLDIYRGAARDIAFISTAKDIAEHLSVTTEVDNSVGIFGICCIINITLVTTTIDIACLIVA